jgi:hypothetical protein
VFLALTKNIITGWKGLQGTNDLAYLPSLSEAKKKVFKTLIPVANFIKPFSA